MAELGFLSLTTSTGSPLWLVAGSVFAIEKDPNETFTWVKTPSGDFGVMEAPQEIFSQLHRIFDAPMPPVGLDRLDSVELFDSQFRGDDDDDFD